MTAAEEGVLLLCCRLGDPEAKPLTTPQFRELGLSVRASALTGDPLRQLNVHDLTALGHTEAHAQRIIGLLDREAALHAYLAAGQRREIHPLTCLSPAYPRRLKELLGHSCPPVFFYRGDLTLLRRPSLAVVGSRKLCPENEVFARHAGRTAAENDLTLVSGGAAGADRTAQNACLEAGGSCVIFVPDRLDQYPAQPNILYLSADGYDAPFSNYRALARNLWIHMQGDRVIAAQCTYGSGGTWQGCTKNLKHGWSELFIFDDASDGAKALAERGAVPLPADFTPADLKSPQLSLY